MLWLVVEATVADVVDAFVDDVVVIWLVVDEVVADVVEDDVEEVVGATNVSGTLRVMTPESSD